jgi:hypothetical protein
MKGRGCGTWLPDLLLVPMASRVAKQDGGGRTLATLLRMGDTGINDSAEKYSVIKTHS